MQDHLTGLENVTSKIITHKTKFLDNVCTGPIGAKGVKMITVGSK
jgi:ATPase subunit of ABC transporter with duplicated ATPase domains